MRRRLKVSDKHRRNILIFLSTAAVIIPLDQLAKLWVKTTIALGDSIPTTGFFRLTHVENTGASFGIFQNTARPLAIVSAIGACILLWLGLYFSRRITLLGWTSSLFALGLVLGGTLGNFIDRAFIGHVTDFLKMGPWPDYNIADSAVVVGGLLMAFNLLRYTSAESARDKYPTTSR
jgi:signal peptidase II